MDRLTESLYGRRARLSYEPSVPEETFDAFEAIFGWRRHSGLDVGRRLGHLCACPSGSRIVVDGYRDPTEAVLFVASNFEGRIEALGDCVLKTQAVLARRLDEPPRCRLELADFSPGRLGIGVRYFGMLVRRLSEAEFDAITFEAAGSFGSRYNGYITWALLGANLTLPHDLVVAADQAGFQEVRTTHELFRRTGGARWWFENGRTCEAVFDLDENSRSIQLLREYMIGKGVELS